MQAEIIVLICLLVPLFIANVYGWIKEFIRWRRFKKMKKEVRNE